MTQGELQLIADNLLIEKLFLIDAGLRKQADVGGFLGNIAGDILNWGKAHVNTENGISGILTSLADLMIPSILFRISPVLGGLELIAQLLGFSPTKIIGKILSLLKNKLESGTKPTPEEITNVGKSILATEAGDINEVVAHDLFGYLREFEKRGELISLVKQAQWFGGRPKPATLPDIPFIPDSKAPLLQRLFGNLLQTKRHGKAKWLLGGFVIWIIKNVLLGAGMLAVGEGVKNFISPSKPKSEVPAEEESTPKPDFVGFSESPKEESAPKAPTHSLKSSGRGEDVHKNDGKFIWIIPIINGRIEDTLEAWAVDIYPELQGQEVKFNTSPAFNKTVNELREDFQPGARQISVPTKFKSRKQVVDQFI